MIGYLLIGIALLTAQIKGFCGKKTSQFAGTVQDAVFLNTVRMCLCAIVGLVVVLAGGGLFQLRPTPPLLWITLLSGISNAAFTVLWLLAIRKNAYMTVEIFLMADCFIPIVGNALCFGEDIKLMKLAGLFLLMAAVVIMSWNSRAMKGRFSVTGFLLVVGTAVAEGLLGFTQILYKNYCRSPACTEAVFNFYVYLFSAGVLLFCKSVIHSREPAGTAVCPPRVCLNVTIMAFSLFIGSYVQTLAVTVGELSPQILFPLLKGGSLILSTAMSALFFRERITLFGMLGCMVAFGGLVLVNGV